MAFGVLLGDVESILIRVICCFVVTHTLGVLPFAPLSGIINCTG